jgi:outer membrane lipoprotein-sorting protein
MKSISLFLAACFTLSVSFAQSADDIINKHINAIGGKDNWKKVTSMVQNGTMSVQGAEIQMKRSIIHNEAARTDISLMGMTGYQIVTTKEGWSYMPFQGQASVEAMTADQVKDQQDELDIQGVLIDYAAKGHSAEYLGKEDIEGTECLKVKMTLKGGKSQTLFFDPSTYYIIKAVSVISANGQEAEVETTFSDYQKQPSGIVVPMSTTVPMGPGMNADLTIASVEVNTKLDASLFKPEN